MIKEPYRFYKNNVLIRRGVGWWDNAYSAKGPKDPNLKSGIRLGYYDTAEEAEAVAEYFEDHWVSGLNGTALETLIQEAKDAAKNQSVVDTLRQRAEKIMATLNVPAPIVTPAPVAVAVAVATPAATPSAPFAISQKSEPWKPDNRKVVKDIFEQHVYKAWKACQDAFPHDPFRIDPKNIAYHFSQFLATQCKEWSIQLKS